MSFLGAEYCTPLTIMDIRNRNQRETIGLHTISTEGPSQKWGLQISLAVDAFGGEMLAAKVQAHRAKYGISKPFNIPMPQHLGIEPNINRNTVITTVVSKDIRSDSIEIEYPLPRQIGEHLMVGRFIRFGNHNKVYMITEADEFSVGRKSRIEFAPELLARVPNGTSVDLWPDCIVHWNLNGIEEVAYSKGVLNRLRIAVTELL